MSFDTAHRLTAAFCVAILVAYLLFSGGVW